MASEWTPSLVTFPLTVSPFVWNRITLTRATITTTTPPPPLPLFPSSYSISHSVSTLLTIPYLVSLFPRLWKTFFWRTLPFSFSHFSFISLLKENIFNDLSMIAVKDNLQNTCTKKSWFFKCIYAAKNFKNVHFKENIFILLDNDKIKLIHLKQYIIFNCIKNNQLLFK